MIGWGAVCPRGESDAKNRGFSGPEPSGGYYSKAEVRELVALAAGFGIEVVPEVDVPGHCYALVQAVPALRDAGENGLYHSIQSFPNNCLNPASRRPTA